MVGLSECAQASAARAIMAASDTMYVASVDDDTGDETAQAMMASRATLVQRASRAGEVGWSTIRNGLAEIVTPDIDNRTAAWLAGSLAAQFVMCLIRLYSRANPSAGEQTCSAIPGVDDAEKPVQNYTLQNLCDIVLWTIAIARNTWMIRHAAATHPVEMRSAFRLPSLVYHSVLGNTSTRSTHHFSRPPGSSVLPPCAILTAEQGGDFSGAGTLILELVAYSIIGYFFKIVAFTSDDGQESCSSPGGTWEAYLFRVQHIIVQHLSAESVCKYSMCLHITYTIDILDGAGTARPRTSAPMISALIGSRAARREALSSPRWAAAPTPCACTPRRPSCT